MKEKLRKLLEKTAGASVAFDVFVPEHDSHGHYSTNLALRLAKEKKTNPMVLAKELVGELEKSARGTIFERVEVAPPGFINFWLGKEEVQKEFKEIAENKQYGAGGSLKGKTVMIEYTDPNPFKLFHIGHLMSNAIGESIANLYEAAGAKVLRVNYQGDIGLHVAKAVWAVIKLDESTKKIYPDATQETIVHDWEDLVSGKAYRMGNDAYETDERAKKEIVEVNKKLYEKSDPNLNRRYEEGRKASLKYFEAIYKRLGTKFYHYFFESEVAGEGVQIVKEHPDVFVESDGAIVFRGEEHDLHTRVFINNQGLPTYEAKELGLNKKKFELDPDLDLSIIITGNEVNDYFRVLIKAMGLVLPEIAKRTRHIGHGMLRLPEGKMSSRTGNVVAAEDFIERVKKALVDRENSESDTDPQVREANREAIAIGAIKYSILKQSIGQDIVFDFEKSLSIKGDSGPYLQYAYARLRSIVRKSQAPSHKLSVEELKHLDGEIELSLIRKLVEFPTAIEMGLEALSANPVAKYLYELASLANKFYETTPVLKEKNAGLRAARLLLIEVVARTIKQGLALLGIKAPEQI